MPLILGANQLTAGGYEVDNSLRFNSGDSLTRTVTPSSSTSYTVSFWLKLSEVTYSSTPYLWSIGSSAGGNGIYLFDADRKIYFFDRPSGFLNLYNGALRDPSAWYHVVWSVNSGTGTGYINGITGNTHSSIPALNDNTGNKISIHDYVDNTLGLTFVGCYMSEFNFIDGQALTPSSFGETDTATGIWKPKAYTGSFGTNGFYLEFKDSSALGDDTSGNGNDFTVNNLTSIDQTTDTPTNNFATINTLTCNDTATLTSADGNLTITGGNDMGATIGITKGKWYWESKRSNTGTVAHWGIGFTQSWYSSTQIVTGNGAGYFFRNDFVSGLNVSNSGTNGFTNISASSTGSSVANGDIIGVALDLDSATKSVTFYQNGSSVASATFSYDGTSSICFPFIRNNSGAQSQLNFGNPPYSANSYTDGAGYGNFSYSVPSGYYALNTKNLATFG